MVNPSPSRSPSRSLSPGTGAPAWEEGDGDGGCSASVQNNVRGPWSSQKWQRATRAFIWKGEKNVRRVYLTECVDTSSKEDFITWHLFLVIHWHYCRAPGLLQLITSDSLTFGTRLNSTNGWCSLHKRTFISRDPGKSRYIKSSTKKTNCVKQSRRFI